MHFSELPLRLLLITLVSEGDTSILRLFQSEFSWSLLKGFSWNIGSDIFLTLVLPRFEIADYILELISGELGTSLL